jgi:hypothetical protein
LDAALYGCDLGVFGDRTREDMGFGHVGRLHFIVASFDTWGAQSSAFLDSTQHVSECVVQPIFDLVPVIADIIGSHCRGTRARQDFVGACIREDWFEARAMVEGMLVEPWHLRGYQEARLRDFLALV